MEGLWQVAGPPHSGVLRIMMLMIHTETPRVESCVSVPFSVLNEHPSQDRDGAQLSSVSIQDRDGV